MVYTREIGGRPEVVATRAAAMLIGAAVAVAISYLTPAALIPGTDALATLGLVGLAIVIPTVFIPLVSSRLPTRVKPLGDGEGVAIGRRAVTFMTGAVTSLLLIALAVGLYHAQQLGDGEEPAAGLVIAAALAAFSSFWLAQRPWRRRIELRLDALTLVAGEASARIPWDDIDEVVQPLIYSNAIFTSLREYQQAGIRVARRSDTRTTKKRRLEDTFPTGDLACRFTTLLPALRFLAADPANRGILMDPDQTRRMIDDQTPLRFPHFTHDDVFDEDFHLALEEDEETHPREGRPLDGHH